MLLVAPCASPHLCLHFMLKTNLKNAFSKYERAILSEMIQLNME